MLALGKWRVANPTSSSNLRHLLLRSLKITASASRFQNLFSHSRNKGIEHISRLPTNGAFFVGRQQQPSPLSETARKAHTCFQVATSTEQFLYRSRETADPTNPPAGIEQGHENKAWLKETKEQTKARAGGSIGLQANGQGCGWEPQVGPVRASNTY